MQATPVPGSSGKMTTGSTGSTPIVPTPAQKQPKPNAPASAPKAFKVAMPKLEQLMNYGSQAAVIGASALPFYQMYRDRQDAKTKSPAQQLHAMDAAAQKVADLLPLRPKTSLKAHVKDFAAGAYNALDDEAGKLLQPSDQLDPIRNRPTSHIN
jgi:hypothetical protein